MSKPHRTTIAPDSGWQQPARTWGESIQRYVIFRQVPTWRASVKSDGSDRSPCLTASEAQALGAKMHRVLARLSPRLGKPIADNAPTAEDLTELWKRRTESRRDRCSIDLNRHFQRAFLLNAGGYACYYCGRTAWGVYAEEVDGNRRTLRFEIDHRTTRRRLSDRERFDPGNLVAACRSCNVIKGEMLEEQLRAELSSLAAAVQDHSRESGAAV
jgi:5-methylcytosine-specific restriction endonuclease McrA